jgi:phage terminase large subunit
MWVTQFLGREIRVLNYYEAIGQPAQAHFNWLRENGYEGAHIVLPHDGTQQHGPNPTTWETAFKSADWPKVRVVRNQGAGAALQRIQAARRVFPSVWFNEATTEPGREALGAYHEHKDETRQVGLGPVHDWSSHGADAFGLMCLDYEPPRANIQETATEVWTESGDANAGWMR